MIQRVESPVEVRGVYERLLRSVRRVVVGKDRVVDLTLISLLAGGHVLLTDIPGVGKTTLARAITSSIAADFSRIQFTPDLLPSDITGTSGHRPLSTGDPGGVCQEGIGEAGRAGDGAAGGDLPPRPLPGRRSGHPRRRVRPPGTRNPLGH